MKIERMAAPMAVEHVQAEGRFRGYASVFEVEDLGRDRVAPGAFRRSLAEWRRRGTWPKMLWQHDAREPIGVWESMREDGRGLEVEGRLLLDVQRASEAHALLRAGALDGLSVGYETVEAVRDEASGTRTLNEIKLWEVSLVTFPMNQLATVAAVKAAEIRTIRDFEAVLRDALGFSRRDARRLASGGFKALPPRDAAVPGIEGLRAALERAAGALDY